MELKDFIKEVIKDISESIVDSNKDLESIGTQVNPKNVHPVVVDARENIYGHLLKEDEKGEYRRPVHLVNFDIAVASTVKKDGKEGIGVNVAGIKLGKGGGHGSEDNTSSRIKFGIPIALPTSKMP